MYPVSMRVKTGKLLTETNGTRIGKSCYVAKVCSLRKEWGRGQGFYDPMIKNLKLEDQVFTHVFFSVFMFSLFMY